MRRRRLAIGAVAGGVLAAVAAGLLGGPARPGSGTPEPAYPTRLVFDEEFDGARGAPPDPAVWRIARNADATGSEVQCYTDEPQNIATDGGGHLVIAADRSPGENCADGWYRYFTSGRMSTRGTFAFTYGRIEVRARVPDGVGTWPTVWAMGDLVDPWPAGGEIDVLETAGRLPTTLIGTVHGPQRDDPTQQFFLQARTETAEPLADGFHTYGAVWDPDRITWYLDGHAYGSVTRAQADHAGRWVWDHRFYLIVDLALAGQYGGDVAADTVFPQRLVLDWIRVYR